MRARYLGVFLVLCVGLLAAPSQADVRFEGNVSYQVTGSRVVMNVERIRNLSSTRTTGTLNLRLFMTTGPSPFGTGWLVAQRSLLEVISNQPDGRLSPGASFVGIQVSADFTQPPPGTYYVHLFVSEFPDLQTSLDVVSFSQTVTYTDAGGGGAGDIPNGGGRTISDAEPLSLNSPRTDGFIFQNSRHWYRVTPTQAGTLTVRTEGGTDTFCELYDSGGRFISADDDSGVDTNCRIVESVTEGTYYVLVRGFRADTLGIYDLFVEFTPSGTGTTPPPSGNPSAGLGCPTCGGFTLSNTGYLFDVARRTMEVSVRIRNDRSGGTSGSLELQVWLSSERDFGGDLHVASSLQDPIQVGRLGGGSTLEFRSGFVPYFPPGASGNYYVYYILREFGSDGFEERAIVSLGPKLITGLDAIPGTGGGGGGGSLNFGWLFLMFLLALLRLGWRMRTG